MGEELYELFEDILKDEAKINIIMQTQTADELYDYLKNEMPNLTKDEFEDFIIGVLKEYKERVEQGSKNSGPIDDDALDSVAGGVGLGAKIASVGLALMAFLPAVGATNKDNEKPSTSAATSISQSIDKSEKSIASEKFDRVKTWGKDNAGAIAGATFGTMVISTIAGTIKSAMPILKQKKLDRDIFKVVKDSYSADKVDELIKKGANVNAKNKYGESVLQYAIRLDRDNQYAIRLDRDNIVKKLLEAGAYASADDKDMANALQLFIESGNLNMVKKLLKLGVDPNYRNLSKSDYSMLMCAISHRKFDIAKELLRAGADPKVLNLGIYNWRDVYIDGDAELIKLLGEKGANFCFHDSCFSRDDILDELIKQVDAKSKMAREMLNFAAEKGRVGVVRKLLDRGVDVNIKNDDGKTPIFYGYKYSTVLRELMERGANIDARDNKGRTALTFAAAYGDVREVRNLLKAGADVTAKDNDDMTALCAATFHSNEKYDILDALLNTGKFTENDKEDAIETALKHGNRNKADYIENHL